MYFVAPTRRASCVAILLLLAVLVSSARIPVAAQTENQDSPPVRTDLFRLERTEISGGAELITLHARWEGLETASEDNWVPMVSVLRDNMGDLNPENDRLRYVWPLSYTRPSFWQRASSAVPFLYTRVGNKDQSSSRPPPPALDLAAPDREVWQNLFWTVVQNVLLDPYGTPIKVSTRSYRRNVSDYRRSQIVRALSVLSLYQSMQPAGASSMFSESEMAEIQSRLLLTDKTFGGLVDDLNLVPYYQKDLIQTRDERGHNWELLRQRAEAESLYFEPLAMPDGSMTHALIWVARNDLVEKAGHAFDKRFLNIANPWTDKRLLKWQGHSELRYFDADSRPVAKDAPGARAIELIPLALYGLDNPKIPMVLVDFRDTLNPKKREMSQRLLQDITQNVLSLSGFGDMPYFLSRSVFDFVTGKRGMDINQPSRLRTYSQLKLLLALNQSMDPELRRQVSGKLEKVSLNPMENDLKSEAKLARQQFGALLAYATREDGLARQLERDRRREMVALEHGKAEQILFRLANILTLGKYVHREKATPEMEARLDVARRLLYHTNFLRQVSRSNARVDVQWNLEEVRRSLHFIAEHGNDASSRATQAAAKIFVRTNDYETRRACLESLSRINTPKARAELLRISTRADLEQSWKELVISYLTNPNQQSGPFTSSLKNSAHPENSSHPAGPK